MTRLNALWLWLALLCGAGSAWAQDVQPVPPLTGRVIDLAAVLQPADRAQLDAKLADFESRAGPQIVVLLVATTQPEDIAAFAQRIADSWKIGRREVGDGVLLVVARDDRRVRIEVAKALEGAVPDLAARQIIANAITPAFKRGDYAAGLAAGVDALIARIGGEGLPLPAAGKTGTGQGAPGLGWEELAMFFFVGVPVVGGLLTAVLGRKLGSLATAGGAGALAFWISTSVLVAGAAGAVALVLVGLLGIGAAGRRLGGRGGLAGTPVIWGGGGGHGGGGGGGFGSGGGGDFGGGGASGNW